MIALREKSRRRTTHDDEIARRFCMLLKIALKMLALVKARCASAVLGVSAAFFLCVAQIGLLVGWCKTASAIILHAVADV